MKNIKLTKGFFSIVDDEKYEDVLKNGAWHLENIKGHLYARNSKRVFLHHFVFGDKNLDHINNDGLDNRISNLRKATKSQNMMNRPKFKNCSSKYKGVYFCKRDKHWISQIKINGKQKKIGYFLNEEEAALKYDEFAKKLFKEFALLNFVS